MTQTNEQIVEQWQAFLNSSEGSNVVSDTYNGDILAEYIRENHQGVVSYSALCRAIKDPAVLNRLHLKTGRWTAEQIAGVLQAADRTWTADRIAGRIVDCWQAVL